jgi:hypothetical protein
LEGSNYEPEMAAISSLRVQIHSPKARNKGSLTCFGINSFSAPGTRFIIGPKTITDSAALIKIELAMWASQGFRCC